MNALVARLWPTRIPTPTDRRLATTYRPLVCPLCAQPVSVTARTRLITVGLQSEDFTPRTRIAHRGCRRPTRGATPRLVRRTTTPEPSRTQLWIDVALAVAASTVLAALPLLVMWTDGIRLP